MAKPENTNVVPFPPPGGVAPSEVPSPLPELLAGCRDRLAHGAATAFADHLTSAEENLLAFADRAISNEEQNRFFAAHGILTRRGQEILRQFRLKFISGCDEAWLAVDRPAARPAPEASGLLSLVANDDFERELTITKLSSRADYNCSQQLTALDLRIAALRQGRRATQADSPLWPKAVFTAFLAACQSQGSGDEVDLTLLQELGHQIIGQLPGIYEQINRYLAEHDVLPNLPLAGVHAVALASSRTRGEAAAPSPAPDIAQAAALPLGPEQRPAVVGQATSGDVFSQIANALLESQAFSLRPQPRAPRPAQRTSDDPAQVIDALTQLQKGTTDPQRLPGIDPAAVDPTSGDLLRRIRRAPLIASSEPLDGITVDVVAMLFDLILNDRDLPDALRAQVGRLQIPVLKVAMMDKGFFSNRQHPARRLLDAVAGAATGWGERDLPRLTEKLRDIVEAVLNGFDDDISIFTAQLAVLQEFLADEEKRGADAVAEAKSAAEQEDKNAVAREVVAAQIHRHTSGNQTPDLIRDFLERIWQVVLVKIYVQSGKDGKDWEDAVATMDELVWSVSRKTREEERRRLLECLPGLLNRLRTGLAFVDLTDEWDGFFARLIRMHLEAVQQDQGAGERPAVASEPQGSVETSTPGGNPFSLRGSAETRGPAPPIPSTKAVRDERYLDLARSLTVGSWIEFRSARGTKRTLRLNWSSDQRGAYLFSNLQGDSTLIVATTSLAEQLRVGTARILSQNSLTERAVDQILTNVGADGTPTKAV